VRVGVVDVGKNSARVLVADASSETLQDVKRDLVITRLGEGVDAARRLGAEPLLRTVEAVARYTARCRAAAAERIRIIATSAVRDAANREEFLGAIRAATGLDADVLLGEEEARLGFAGATLSLDAPPPYLVVDIGGGSTELVRGRAGAERFVSLDIGSVRLTERHVRNDPPAAAEIEAIAAAADTQVDDAAARSVGEAPVGTLVGLAGTITTVAAIALGLRGYDRRAIHHARIGRERIAEIRALLAAMTSPERRALPAMPRGREDVIVAGVVILERVMARFGCSECLVSESDILDGTALALAGR
jgi:exopolyphosphatase/guanosine-5'-triphosphate,3'-diphosphate pyrophosphatase